MVVNLVELSTAIISIQNHLKRKVSDIIFISNHFTVVNIILVPFNICYAGTALVISQALPNDSGYVYCTDRNKGIKQMCPSDTQVSFEIGGCVNKTSKSKKETNILIRSHLYCFSKYNSFPSWISMCFRALSKWWCVF